MMRALFIIFAIGLIHPFTLAQIAVFGGYNYSFVRNKVLLNEQPAHGFQLGLSFSVKPYINHEKFTVTSNILYSRKGYQQFSGRNYLFNLSYMTLQTLAGYQWNDFIAGQAGLELASLMSSQEDNSLENYRRIDLGCVGGLTLLPGRHVSFYFQLVYGLIPMVNYYRIDPMGNFTGEIHDLKNTCFTVGIKLKFVE